MNVCAVVIVVYFFISKSYFMCCCSLTFTFTAHVLYFIVEKLENV